MVTKNVMLSGKFQEPKDEWETKVIKNWNVEGASYPQIERILRSYARWDFPPKGWYKVNFDGASKHNPGIVGCGITIRNENGYSIGAMAIPTGKKNNYIVEASATLYGFLYAKSMNMEKIWLEGDSLNINNCLNKVTYPSWTIHNII